MNDICVPIPRIAEAKNAEVEIKVANRSRSFNYRVESFDWAPSEGAPAESVYTAPRVARIENLKDSIENYDRNWELVQIYNPGPRDRHIQVLFRQKH